MRGDKPFRDLADFGRRINPKIINKRVLESLIAAGALDELEPDRARLIAGVERILGMATRVQESAAVGQGDMFGAVEERQPLLLPAVEPWLPAEKLQREHDAVGFYLSAHPLDEYRAVLAQDARADLGGVRRVRAPRRDRRPPRRHGHGAAGAPHAHRQQDGRRPALRPDRLVRGGGCSRRACTEYRDLLEPGKSVVVLVGAEDRPEGINVRIQSVESLDKVMAGLKQIRVFVRDEAPLPSVREASRRQRRGRSQPRPPSRRRPREVEMRLPGRYAVTPQIASALRAVKGVVQVELV